MKPLYTFFASVACFFGGIVTIPAFAQIPVSTGLDLWIKADAGVTTSGSQVSAWADQSVNGHNGSQMSGFNQPLLVPNALNGHPVVRFNGTSNFLSLAGQVMTSNQQFTIMGVFTDTRNPSDTSFRDTFSNWDPGNQTTSVFIGTVNKNPTRVRFTDDVGGLSDTVHNQTGVGNLFNPTTPFILTGISTASDAFVYQNSVLMASKGSAISVRNLTTGYVIGRQGTFSGEYWNGDIAELFVYDRALSSSEFQQNVSYLNTKYALASTPEPNSIVLLAGLGASGFLFATRRRKGIANKSGL